MPNAPDVVALEVDLSQYAARYASSVVGMVGPATKGPVNTLTYITNALQYVSTFGSPMSGSGAVPYAAHAAVQFLREGNQLWFVRIQAASGAAVAASAVVLNSSSQTVLTVSGSTPGTWGNYTTSGTKIRGVQVRIDDPLDTTYTSSRFRLTVVVDGVEIEVFDNLVWTPSTDTNYFTTRINGVSQYITVTAGASATKPSNTTYSMSGGTNGTVGLVDSDYIGTATSIARTGMQLLADQDSADINVLCVPGASRNVMQQGVAVVESRKDCIFLIDPPVGFTSVAAVRNWVNGTDGSGNSFNSSYAAAYWPWVEYYDQYNDAYVFTPPSGWMCGVIALTDATTEPWFAPAGLTRGLLRTANRLEYSPTKGERELLASPGEVVNPIIKKPGYGIVVWSQKTTQRISSALDRVNVRRLMLVAEKTIVKSIEFLVFEPNDPVTWRRFEKIVNPVLDTLKARRGLEKFQVICNSTTNTDTLRDQNTMRGILLMQPVKTAEVIQVNFVVTSAGADFSEVLASVV